MNVELILGENVRGYRNQLGYSQEELAEHANLHRTYIGTIERAEQTATVTTVVRLAEALKIEPFLLLIPRSFKEDITLSRKPRRVYRPVKMPKEKS